MGACRNAKHNYTPSNRSQQTKLVDTGPATLYTEKDEPPPIP